MDIVILVLLVAAFLVLQYLDINSTKTVINRGVGAEANPVMAWLMKTFPASWPYIKAGAATTLALAMLLALSVHWAIGLFILYDALFAYVVSQNYAIAKQ